VVEVVVLQVVILTFMVVMLLVVILMAEVTKNPVVQVVHQFGAVVVLVQQHGQ
jgi:hypothetical protein